MTLKPLDIQQQSFQVAFRGYDRAEVTEFLDIVRRDYEALVHANLELTSRLDAASQELDEARVREQELRGVLTAAPRETAEATAAAATSEPTDAQREQAESIVEQARTEAALIKREAELKAAELLSEANAKVAARLEELSELSRNRQRLKASLKGILDACTEALDDDGVEAGERFKVRSPDHDELPSIPPEALAAASASSAELSAASAG